MKLRGINFGNVLSASGVQGFFGEGYWYHKILRMIPGFTFDGTTFIAKTTTICMTSGGLPLTINLTPKELMPRCIIVKPLKKVVLNAVGLSGPGAKSLFEDGRWQKRTKPFFISFMPTATTTQRRVKELETFVALIIQYRKEFHTLFGLQLNISCPNANLELMDIGRSTLLLLDAMSILNIPIIIKINVLMRPELAKEISEHPNCDAICVSNSIPWGTIPESINWKNLFGSNVSPLAEFGGGGLSGKPLLPIVCDWIEKARACGLTRHLDAGGGIFSPNDVNMLHQAGASSISLGSVSLLRPWRMKQITKRANKLFTQNP